MIGLPFRTRGLAPVHRMHSSGTYTYGQRWYNYRGQWLKVTFNDGIEWWTDDPCTKQQLADVKEWFLGLKKVKN